MFERSTADARAVETTHRCRFDTGCTNADVEQHDTETGRPVKRGALIADGAICRGCMTRLETVVRYLPKDYDRLRAALGEYSAAGSDKVRSSRDAAIPLNTQVEALMARIVEVAERASDMVDDVLGVEDGGPHRAAVVTVTPPEGSQPETFRVQIRGNRMADLSRAVKKLSGTLDVLIQAPVQAALVWSRIPTGDEEWDDKIGQPRELVEMSGLDVARELVEINRLVGVQLGKAKLRHHYSMPCPAYDAHKKGWCLAFTVGRDDGADRFDCTTCGASWTEAEYGFLQRMTLDSIREREENNMMRYLLAEAYARLDEARELLDRLDGDAAVELPGAGPLILGRLQQILGGHLAPEDRQASSSPPKRKRAKAIAAADVKAIEQ